MATLRPPSPPSEDSASPEDRASSPILSRHIDNLIACLNTTDASGTGKRKRSLATHPYTHAARWIPLAIHPFVPMNNLIYAGLPDVETAEEYTQNDLSLHQKVLKLVPTFKTTLEAFSSDPRVLSSFIAHLASSAHAARQEDSASLKSSILQYLLPEPTLDDLQPPLSVSRGKNARGFNHPITAYYLCPVHLIGDYGDNLDLLREKVETGEIKVRAKQWPAFMYDFTDGYDPDNKQDGLCRGLLLVRVFRHIFTGPSSAFGTPTRATKDPKAVIHGLTAATGRTIAYAAVQARFALSSDEEWGFIDNAFSYEKFYENIVTLFEDDPQDPWVIDTLEWWNRQVPGLKPRCRKQKRRRQRQDPESSDDNAANEILLQRRAQTQQIARRSITSTVSPPPLPVHQAARNQHVNQCSATQPIPPPPSPVQQEVQHQQVDRRLAIRAESPPPSPVQRAVRPLGITQPNMQAYEDSDGNGTPPPSTRFPPRFLARSRVIVNSPHSDHQPSPPPDTENVDTGRQRH